MSLLKFISMQELILPPQLFPFLESILILLPVHIANPRSVLISEPILFLDLIPNPIRTNSGVNF